MNGFPDATPLMDLASYTSTDTERWIPETDQHTDRSPFERDRARILHSSAFRRLAYKTQMMSPMGEGSSRTPRNRLTHSLECAQIGREIGQSLGCDPDLVDAAGLAHDLGHPPFGHTGEHALNEVAQACGGFEGNAQTLRLLTRIEPKRFTTREGSTISAGLNLTRATLDAATKYPWPRGGHPADPQSPKFGCYEDDQPVFTWLRAEAPGTSRCFEAQVMDWADDVAYSTHDVEDGIRAHRFDPNLLRSGPERCDLSILAAERYAPRWTDPEELIEALDRLLGQEWWPVAYDGSITAQAHLKNATSELINRFSTSAQNATRDHHGDRRLTRYGADLVIPRWTLLECAILKAIADRYVRQRDAEVRLRAHQRTVIAELAEAINHNPTQMQPQFLDQFNAASDDRGRLRAVVDQISVLTDAEALTLRSTPIR